MGLGSWLRGALGGKTPPPQVTPEEVPADHSTTTLKFSFEFNPCVEVAGTTTFAKYAVAALVERKGLGERDYFEVKAQLQRETDNPVDPHAVAVLIDGEKVGYLPSYAAKSLPLLAGASQPAPHQLRCTATKDDRLTGPRTIIGAANNDRTSADMPLPRRAPLAATTPACRCPLTL